MSKRHQEKHIESDASCGDDEHESPINVSRVYQALDCLEHQTASYYAHNQNRDQGADSLGPMIAKGIR